MIFLSAPVPGPSRFRRFTKRSGSIPSAYSENSKTQMCSFVPGKLDGSPDRVDALVWALTGLMIEREPQPNIRFPLYRR
jgi:hypothetical protein